MNYQTKMTIGAIFYVIAIIAMIWGAIVMIPHFFDELKLLIRYWYIWAIMIVAMIMGQIFWNE
jgi:hypothetical protein